jgi:hypothetical protein
LINDERLITGCHDNQLRVFKIEFNDEINEKGENPSNNKKQKVNENDDDDDEEIDEDNVIFFFFIIKLTI